MRLSDFDYTLPPELIAKEPVKPRDHSRLMVLDREKKTISHRFFYELPEILTDRDVLVVNRSKVIPARLCIDGCEIFLLSPVSKGCYEALVKPGRKFKKGARFFFPENVTAEVKEIFPDGRRIIQFVIARACPELVEGSPKATEAISPDETRLLPCFRRDRSSPFDKAQGDIAPCNDRVLQKLGQVPLPPYLKGSKATFQDYQTVYCREKGSVAAPTAGLHFTPALLQQLNKKSVQMEKVLLHVGLGTFQPVRNNKIEGHQMHEEYFCLSKDGAGCLNRAKRNGKRIIAVGTTSTRVLESQADASGILKPRTGKTNIFIYPGYHWKFTDALLTNFHLPKSTLFMLVCSFAGTEFMKKAYEEAISRQYRFYSFGDAMLIF